MNDAIFNYPTNTDFRKAIFNPQNCFQDQDLQQCIVVRDEKSPRKQPLSWAGNFAIVFKLTSETLRKSWAVRCFTQPPDDTIQQRYQSILNYPSYHQSPYFVPFEFIQEGIKVDDQWYPIVKMEWQEGQTLDDYIEQQINDSKHLLGFNLLSLKNQLEKIRQDLQELQIAHGDLQHGNILVTPRQEIKLVDYDEMYIPDLKDSPPINEKGHPNYQHPQRSVEDWGVTIDNFSFEVIILSITALIQSPDIWKKFHRDDNSLIFVKEDFLNPSQSELFKYLQQIENDEVKTLTQKLREKCEDEKLAFPDRDQNNSIFNVDSETLEFLEPLPTMNNEENHQENDLELTNDAYAFADILFTEPQNNQPFANNPNVVVTPSQPLNYPSKKSGPVSRNKRTPLFLKPISLSLILAVLGITGFFSFPQIKNFLFPAKVVLNEDFTNPSTNWSLSESANISQGELLQQISPSPSGNKTIWYTNYANDNIIKSDYSVEVRKLNQHDAAIYGILANVQPYDDSAYYYLLINRNGSFMMGKQSPEGWKNEIEWTKHDSIKLGTEVNQLRVLVEKNVITGFINGEKVGSFRDDSYPSGTIGLYTEADNSWKTQGIAFDNVSMRVTLTPLLGIRMSEIKFGNLNVQTPDLQALKEDLKDNKGVEIDIIYPNSPAEKAGLKVKDIIYKIDNKLMKNSEDVRSKIAQSSKIGQSVKMTIIRNGKKKNIRVKLDPYLIPKEKIW
jgi:hypothetical protein